MRTATWVDVPVGFHPEIHFFGADWSLLRHHISLRLRNLLDQRNSLGHNLSDFPRGIASFFYFVAERPSQGFEAIRSLSEYFGIFGIRAMFNR